MGFIAPMSWSILHLEACRRALLNTHLIMNRGNILDAIAKHQVMYQKLREW